MTEILCKWLNEDVNLSRTIDPVTFAEDFANGYFFGEILSKHGLQDDFNQFSTSRQAAAKVNNFMRLEPTINLLEIPFNTNIARDIMQEKRAATTQLLYQMYIALTNKQKRNLTGAAMETMRAQGPVRLEQYESKLYKQQLKAKTPRQTDLDLTTLKMRYEKHKLEHETTRFDLRYKDEENKRDELQKKREYLLERSKQLRVKQAEVAAKIKDAIVKIPKTPPGFQKENILERRKLFEKNEGEKALKDIASFEKRFKSAGGIPDKFDNDMNLVDVEEYRAYDEIYDKIDPIEYLKPKSNDDYIGKIRNRLHEDAHARKEREKRRRKVLVDQLKANEALEEAKREESLVAHMLRQSQFERRIAVELLHARHEKDVIKENCIIKQREIEEKRTKEFIEALDRERELARLARLEYMDQAKKDKELHDIIAAQRAEARYIENYELCKGIVNQIIDFTCKVGEYRNLTDNLIPPKLWRDWINMFKAGVPLYQDDAPKADEEALRFEKMMDEETMKLLDEGDFIEYKNMIGEWEPESNGIVTLPQDNKITGYVIDRLHNLCYPVEPGAPAPIFPKFPLKALVIGKPFSGKTSALEIVQRESGLNIINPQTLINEAIEAYKNNPVFPDDQDNRGLESDVDGMGSQSRLNSGLDSSLERTKSMTERMMSVKKTERKSRAGDAAPAPPVEQETPESDPLLLDEDLMVRRLGKIALTALENGDAIKDEIIVHIMVEKIRRLPKEKGWVIDGFPLTYNQTKLLEKALSGYDNDKPVPTQAKNDSVLAPNPRPQPPPPKHVSAIDIIINLNITNETALKRSAGRYFGNISQSLYHQQFKPPPEGSYTGLNRKEIVLPVNDPSHDMEQLQHRITSFEDNLGKVLKFYERFGRIEHLYADKLDQNTLAIEIHRILDDFVEERERKRVEEIERKLAEENAKKQAEQKEAEEKERKRIEDEQAEANKRLEIERAAQEALERSQSPPKSSKGTKGKGNKSPKGGARSPKGTTKSPKGDKDKEKSETRSASKATKKSASPKGRSKKTITPPVTNAPPEVPGTPVKIEDIKPVEPGSEEWIYVDERIELTVAKILCDQWDVIEINYIDSAKYVFRSIRVDREQVIRYFYNIKKDFKEYLRRPDSKKEFVDMFIKMYNNIPDDIRDDEEVKAELHQRVEDLKEDLWSICDRKKEEAEREREAIMNDGWLSDKLGILTNHYITLMQTELDRFMDSARMLKDYYKCMQAPVPDEIPKDYPRLPLIDLRNPEELPKADGVDSASIDRSMDQSNTGEIKPPKSPKSPRTKSPKSPKQSPSLGRKGGKKGKKTPIEILPTQAEVPEEANKDKKTRIPLVPRRPMSAQDGKDKRGAARGKTKNPDEASPVPPEDIDERLVFDSQKLAYSYVNAFMMGELALVSDSDNKEVQQVEEKVAKTKGAKVGKVVISKSRSPSAKEKDTKAKSPKGKKQAKANKVEEAPQQDNDSFEEDEAHPGMTSKPSSYNLVVVLSEEEKAKKALKEKIKKEYWTALQKEESSFKARVEAIKLVASNVIQNLKQKADNGYKSMNDWLGSRWMKEMNSIKNLVEIIKYYIENKEKIKEELVLEQEEFFVDKDIVVLRSPTPPRRPDPVEQSAPEYFTVDSLMLMYAQFKLVAPEGLVAVKTFADIYSDLATLNYGTETLPEQWSNLNQNQVEALAKMLSNGSEFVDWRHWLLFASAPWPFPTQNDLLTLLAKYRAADMQSSGLISKSTFFETPLWFRLDRPLTPPDIAQPHSYDRFSNLLKFWYELFSVPVKIGDHEENMIDYKNMLLYMSATPDGYEGFSRALSVSQEAYIPRLDVRIQMKVPSFTTPEHDSLKQKSHSETQPNDQNVAIQSVYRVLHHGERQHGDTHRFASTEDPEDFMSMERLIQIYNELDEDNQRVLPYTKLIAHPVLCEMISSCTKFRAPDFRSIFNMQATIPDDGDLLADRRTPNEQ